MFPQAAWARGRPPLPCRATGGGDEESLSIPDSLPLAGDDSDWRDFRAKLVASSSGRSATEDGGVGELWAHTIPGPEQGCLLVAHPLMFTTSQTYFFQV